VNSSETRNRLRIKLVVSRIPQARGDAMQSIDAMLLRLRALATAFSVNERPTFHPGASPEAISALQAVTAGPVPEDFAYFLSQCDSIIAMDVWNGYWIGGIEWLRRSVACGDFPSAISEGGNPDSVIPVATDGGGNAFLLSLGSDKVWKWNHESGDATLVARGFAAFLARIVEDWEHFLSSDSTWSYLSG
jgi:SMI1/KNR4 family protein SUKH-1